MIFLLAYLNVHYLILLSMVHEYAYFFMNTFGKWSIVNFIRRCVNYESVAIKHISSDS